MSISERKPARVAESARKQEPLLATRVAEMHYSEGMSNSTIGKKLGISRFRVARLLDLALDIGIVTISVNAPALVDSDRSRRLRERYRLADALVTPHEPLADAGVARAAVSAVAAQFVAELVNDGAKIGISWGKTMAEFAVASRQFRFPTCDAVQLLGNLPTLEGSMHAGDVLRTLADSLGGAVYPLHASLILPDEATARGVRGEASTRLTLATFRELDVAVLGVGSWDPPSSQLFDVLPKDESARIRQLGPVADVCANLFDAAGGPVVGEFSDRTIGISRDELAAVPMAVAVASGAEKAGALRAVLASGIIDTLVTDAEAADLLLA